MNTVLFRGVISNKNFQKITKKNILTIIDQNTTAYREFLGHNRKKLEPGLRLCVPLFHKIKYVQLYEISRKIEDIECFTKDNVPVRLSGVLFIKVFNPEYACYNIDNYKKSAEYLGSSAVRSIIGNLEYDHITSDRNIINEKLCKIIGNNIKEWGVNCTRFEIQDFCPSNSQIQHQLEKQMEAERRRRENELDTQASIRTAEGKKLSQLHEAEAEFKTKKLQIDAKIYEIDNVTKATEEQFHKLKKQIGDATVQYLIDMQKIKAFEELAKSNNKVYFIDKNDIMPRTNPLPLIEELKT